MLDLIKKQLVDFPPKSHQPLGDKTIREAAVLIAITRSIDPCVVFIKRAEHVNTHRGQVAFPGGMWEPEDQSLLHTALRESEEEIALLPDNVEMIAALKPRVTRFDVRVSPFVGFIPEGLEFIPELAELDSVFQVPFSYLTDAGNLATTTFEMGGETFKVPCYLFEGYCIWGFTLHVLAEVLKQTTGLDIKLEYQPLN